MEKQTDKIRQYADVLRLTYLKNHTVDTVH